MSLLGQVLVTLLVLGFIFTYLALRLRDWRFGAAATLFSLPIAVVAQVSYGLLLLLPILLLASSLALRWSVGPTGWSSLLVLGAALWLIGAASPLLWHWSAAFYFVYFGSIVAGFVALIWNRPPQTILRSRALRRSS